MTTLVEKLAGTRETGALDVSGIHAEHGDFLWASLGRLGVRDADLEDMVQEVFIVIHRKLHTFDASSKLTTWLFAICMRVAAGYHRRAHRRREQSVDPGQFGATADPASSPDELQRVREARQELELLLDGLDLDKRAVFVMFEIDEMSCAEIAAIMGVPIGTVYSRLHAARKALEISASNALGNRGTR